MRRMSGGEAAVAALQVENVDHVFGLIGSATMEMFDALYDADDVSFIGVHDERTGTHMADGYARASGQAGVVLAGQNGPGGHQSGHRARTGQGCLFASCVCCRCPVNGAPVPRCLSGS